MNGYKIAVLLDKYFPAAVWTHERNGRLHCHWLRTGLCYVEPVLSFRTSAGDQHLWTKIAFATVDNLIIEYSFLGL